MTHSHTHQDQTSLNLSMDAKKQDPKQVKPSQNSKKHTIGRGIIQVPRHCKKRIEKFFHSLSDDPDKLLDYYNDWDKQIKPQSEQGRLNRWRFAFCTVHTPWLYSCLQYQDIEHMYEWTDYESLETNLSKSSGGMYKIKAEGIDNLHKLWSQTELFDLQALSSRSDWRKRRNKLTKKLTKLGLAKTSFAIEMLEPIKCQVICIDRHMFKAFGWENVDDSSTHKQYEYFEDYWLDLSEEYKVPPAISRNLFWDIIQEKPNSMYWGEYLKEYVYTTRN